MKTFKPSIFLLSIVALISACSAPTTVPTVVAEATATVSTAPPTDTPIADAPTSTATATTVPAATATTVSSSGTGACVNAAEFVADVSIPDGSVFAPEIAFVKTWRVKNTGTCTWDHRYSLVFVDGTLLTPYDHLALPFVTAPGQTLDLSLDMTAPIYPGAYESHWKFQAPNGGKFGVGKKDSPLWVKLVIASPDATTISGFVYQDLNGNSKYDFDDQLMANREVWLQQGSCNLNGARLASAISGSDGRYLIAGNFNGAYCLSLPRPDGTVYTLNLSVTIGQVFSAADMQDAVPNAVISGNVWNDTGQPDGVQQLGEPNLAGVTVLLQLGPCASLPSLNSPVPIAATTDAQGKFSFGSLYGGTYCVSVPTGYGNNAAILASGAWTMPAYGSHQITVQAGGQISVSFGWQYR
jgi:hypothetical protein